MIIVASVSCIYGIGSPQVYNEKMQLFKVGEVRMNRDEVLRKLVKMQYQRNDSVLGRGAFRVRGEVLEIMPSYAESAYRIALFGDEIEGIQHFDPLTGEVLDEIDHVSVWPASHYVTKKTRPSSARSRRSAPNWSRARPSSRRRANSSRRTACASAPHMTWR